MTAPPTTRWARLRRLLASAPIVPALTLATALVSGAAIGVSELAAGRVRVLRDDELTTHQIADHVASVRAATLRAESAQRGFLLTMDRRYLTPFRTQATQAEKSFVELAALTRGNAAWRQRSQAVIDLSTQRFDEMRLTVTNAEQGRIDKAMAIVRAGYGIQMMEDLVRQSDAFESDMRAEVGRRHAAVDRELLRQRIGVGAAVCAGLALLLGLAVLTARRMTRGEARRSELLAQADRLEREVTTRTEELSSLSSYLQASSEHDRARLARDLHDELGGILVSAKLDVAWLQGHSKNADPEIVPRLTRLSSVLDEAVDLKRRVIENLRPSLLDHLGLSAALNWYVGEACRKAGLQVELQCPDDDDRAPPDVAIAIYRIVQEGLTNTIKHARATRVRIVVRHAPQAWQLRVDDDGVGIADFRADMLSHGMAGMRQRARALGGQFSLTTSPAGGVTIEVSFPVRRTDAS